MLQKQLEFLQKQVNDLQLKRQEDELKIALKSKKIEKLRKKLGEDETFSEISSDSLTINRPKRPFVKSNSVAGYSNLCHYESHSFTSGSSKSIWASLNETSVDFGFFSDVISQPCSEKAFSGSGSEFGATSISTNVNSCSITSPIEECKPLWSLWNGSQSVSENY